ncbi:transglutaminase-like cysteine peptidase [Paludibacterium purpuratum]|uniref:Transglutaminase-like cysteine proteinase BTLCP n=1 Tax=Paludibacterium purpuratum TaxID=1144873 RepID=A0A4R7BB08_9NEIS|nr:transglutaminase-like cysteine peptidase [Paludibacterium purpuratum]TDR82124.1 transglutaminase-like cysteine proteinase BTLCP [Paludibacterium purpuratum]
MTTLSLCQPCLAEPVPPDPTARWHQMLQQLAPCTEMEQVEQVNLRVNQLVRFAYDLHQWQRQDHWSTPHETLRTGLGDCEDYAILKYFTLRALGVAPERLWLILARLRVGGAQSVMTVGHMVLAYQPSPGADLLILDNLVGSLYPASYRTDLEQVLRFNHDAVHFEDRRYPPAWLPQWDAVLSRMASR